MKRSLHINFTLVFFAVMLSSCEVLVDVMLDVITDNSSHIYDSNNSKIGEVDESDVYDDNYRRVGYIEDENIYNSNHKKIGCVSGTRVYNSYYQVVGYVEGDKLCSSDNTIIGYTKGVSDVQGAAAILLLLND